MTRSQVSQEAKYRPRRKSDAPLEDMHLAGLGRRPGSQRCHAVDLLRGSCQEARFNELPYCYYHDKAASGLMEPTDTLVYPLWPLPPSGYVLDNGQKAAA